MIAPTPAAPRFMSSAVRIFDLSLGRMLWSRRSVFLAVVVGGPVLLAAAVRLIVTIQPSALPRVNGGVIGGDTLFGVMMWLLYLRFVVPVLGVFYGTSLIADEVDDKTITYLFTRPIPRSAVLAGKFLAYLVCTVLLVLPSVVCVYFLIAPLGGSTVAASFPDLAADLGILALGLAAYGAVFGLVGASLRRPLVIGLVFAFGWEPVILLFPGYLKRLSVAYYLQGLVPHAMPTDSTVSALMQLFADTPSLTLSLASLAVLTLGGLWLAGRAVESRDYVLEQ